MADRRVRKWCRAVNSRDACRPGSTPTTYAWATPRATIRHVSRTDELKTGRLSQCSPMRRAMLRTMGIPSLLVLAAFLITFGLIRAITSMIRVGVGPFHNVTNDGLHIHHMVWGILILLAVGFLWLVHFGAGETPIHKWVSSMSAIAYGIGAALTLDEFALWVNFKDVYWEKQGLESLEAVVFFLSLLPVAIWGGPFLAAVARECVRKLRSCDPYQLARDPAS